MDLLVLRWQQRADLGPVRCSIRMLGSHSFSARQIEHIRLASKQRFSLRARVFIMRTGTQFGSHLPDRIPDRWAHRSLVCALVNECVR